MERVIQYWDDLDDLIGALGLYAERIRRIAVFALSTCLFLALLVGGILLALAKPPLALAAVTILVTTLMYRTVTNPRRPEISA